MHPRLSWETVQALVAERHREADSIDRHVSPVRRGSRHATAGLNTTSVTVRYATPHDAGALERLAALDSGSVPLGAALVAEVDGELVAALPLRDGRALADPFKPTAELLRLLELRAAQLGTDRRRHRQPRFWRLADRRTAAAEATSGRHG